MTKEKLLEQLAYIRKIHWMNWEDFSKEAKEKPWMVHLRDVNEMNIRALDFVMEAIRRDAL